MKFGKGLIWSMLITILSLGGCSSRESASVETATRAQTALLEEKRVEVVQIVPTSVSYTLTAVGSLRTPEHVTISPKKAGIIEKILVREGDRVHRGQVLIQLDEVDARLQVERAEARLREAEATVETNRIVLLRYRKLYESRVISQQTLDDLLLKVKVDEAKLDLARVELDMAKQNLLDHRIISPIEGMVNLRVASLGEHVNVAPKDEIMTIVQMDPLELEFYLPEQWVGKVRLGSQVQFTVKAFPDEKFTATLQFISPTADPATRNVRMKAAVPNVRQRLKPGFFAEVTVQTGANLRAVVVPESALFSQEGKMFAFVVENGVVHRREVETGHRFDGKVEILKGVRNGEQVVTAGHEQLSDGTRVTISTQKAF
ncbi:MAG: efflux RND transporter periplasmic adaptor subunit [Thermodesulfobacteriota bacterium]